MTKQGSELFLVDNSDADWKVARYLHDWCQIAKGIAMQSLSEREMLDGVELR